MSKIGIFWIHSGAIFGKSVNIDSGIEGIPGVIDSQENHADVWDRERPWVQVSKELSFSEYQDVPRGRVLFLPKQNQSLVYADKCLMANEAKLLISKFFEFNPDSALWKKDSHYTTSKKDIDSLFGDNDLYP